MVLPSAGLPASPVSSHPPWTIRSVEIEPLHGLLEHPGVQIKPLGLLNANGKHFRRVVDPINVDALGQIVEQQATCATSHIQNRLTMLTNQVAIEEAIRPGRGIATQKVPGISHHPRILVTFLIHRYVLLLVVYSRGGGRAVKGGDPCGRPCGLVLALLRRHRRYPSTHRLTRGSPLKASPPSRERLRCGQLPPRAARIAGQ